MVPYDVTVRSLDKEPKHLKEGANHFINKAQHENLLYIELPMLLA